jgi:hypothetical protein
MKILKSGDAYFNLNVLDAFYFLDPYKTLTLGSGDNQREFLVEPSKYDEFKTKLSEFVVNSEMVLDISDYLVKQ